MRPGVCEFSAVMLVPLLLALALVQQTDTSIVGSYRTEGDFQIAIRQDNSGKQGKRLLFLDYETGLFGSLQPSAGANFKSGADAPVVTTMRVERDAARRVRAISFSNNGEDPRRAVREHKYTEREVRFKSGDTELTGTLRVPTSAGSHAAVVLVHDSGAQDREGELAYLGFIADFFASNGIASFSYDKRKNSGAVRLDDLADDAAAAMATVEQQAGVAATKVGIWGIGEGGVVAPMAVEKHGKAAFVILNSAPARGAAADSLSALQSVKAPVIAFFGAKDSSVPPDNATLIQSTLRAAGNRDVQIVTLPEANHLFQRPGRFVPGYFDRMLTWVLSHSLTVPGR